ncbi:MAG: hypothetical protein AAFX50_09290, partial [Acidobacteriota bacterium]
AACLEARQGRPGRWPVAGLLWALIVLGGDPLYAALAAALALSTLLLESPGDATGATGATAPPWHQSGLRLAAAFGLGLAVATPMIVEMLRILPASFRGHWRYSMGSALSQSWDPRTALEWFLPFLFGPLDYDFWGRAFFGGNPPLLYALYPGTLALALALVAGRPRGHRLGLWAWTWIGVGGFLSLGIYNPAVWLLYRLPGASVLRYPIKVWLLVAIGASLLAGLGLERAMREGRGPRLRRILGIATLAYLALWLLFLFLPAPFAAALRALDPDQLRGPLFAAERLRWLTLCFWVLLTAGALWLACRWLKTKPGVAAALLVAVHVGSQCFVLQPLYDTDDAAAYTREPPLLADLGEDQRGTYGAFHGIFGHLSSQHALLFPDRRFFWLSRETYASMDHVAGAVHGRRYDFNHSPEGLDTFVNITLTQSLESLDDAAGVRVLAASGVDRLFMHRPLEGVGDGEARLLRTDSTGAWPRSVYAIERAMPDLAVAGRVRPAPHLNAALDLLVADGFDPGRDAVVRNLDLQEPLDGPPGRAQLVEEGPERLVVDVSSTEGGVLVTRRAWLPIYRASVDGEAVEPAVVNIHKLGVPVPPGDHRVELWVDRTPTRLATAAAVLALLTLCGWVVLGFRGSGRIEAGASTD